MPPRDPELPEGTDQIIDGAGAGAGGGASGGFVASGSSDGAGAGSASSSGSGTSGGGRTTEKLVTQVKEQVVSLRGQATEKMRGFADEKKERATSVLDDVAKVIDDAAQSIDDRLGSEYGDYARRASGAVSGFAGRVRDKDLDDLIDDTREIVRKSPGVAIAAAAVLGFALMRVVRTGLDQDGASGGGSKGRKPRRTSNADTTTSGGV